MCPAFAAIYCGLLARLKQEEERKKQESEELESKAKQAGCDLRA